MENERSETSQEQRAVRQDDSDHHERADREREDFSHPPEEQGRARRDSDNQAGDEPPSDHSDRDQPAYESAPQDESGEGGSPPPEGQGQPGNGQRQGRGRRRGGRGRPSPRDRRMQGRERRRDPRPSFQAQGGGGSESSGGSERLDSRQGHQSDLPPEKRSLLQHAKAEVERVQEVLEGVLRDLEEVSAALTKAEHEKDLAEAEIEQLRESLRRLHR